MNIKEIYNYVKIILKLPNRLKKLIGIFIKTYLEVNMGSTDTDKIVKVKAFVRAFAIILSIFGLNLAEEHIELIVTAIGSMWALLELILGYIQSKKMKTEPEVNKNP